LPLTDISFLAHQGSQSPSVLEGFLSGIRADQPGSRVGATVFLPRYVPATCSAYLNQFRPHAAYVLADPETHKLDVMFDDRGRGRHEFTYLQESDPVANRRRVVDGVLSAQVAVGAYTLISPWLTHGVSMSTRNFRATMRFAEEAAAHPLAQQHDLVFGVAATEQVIREDDSRDDLLDAIVELPDAHIYFRMQVTPPTSYAQYGDEVALRGLRSFVEGLAANGRRTLLPQTGLAGWLMLPFGALAFGSGINASMQRYVAPVEGFGTQPLEWYFDPNLLGFVLRTEMLAITQLPTYTACTCRHCTSLTFGPGPQWDRNEAGLHYLWWCAQLAEEVRAAATPAQVVQARIAAAQTFWNDLQQAAVPLDLRSEPRHLAAWSAAVA
jgi:hypothetical protein